MEVRYNAGQDDRRDVSNPVFDDKQQMEGQIQLDDTFSVPDEALKNPLFLDSGKQQKTDLMKVIMFVMQAVNLVLIVAMIIIGIVTLANVYGLTGSDSNYNPLMSSCNATCNDDANVKLLTGIAQLLQLTRNVSKNVGSSKMNFDVFSEAYENSSRTIYDIVGTLSNVKDTSTATAGAVNDILLAVGDILDLQNSSSFINSLQPVSCKDIKSTYPESSSGYYHVNSRDIYCNMDQLCGSGGGWTRVGYFDMTDATHSCPDGFRLFEQGNVRACGRNSQTSAGCSPSLKLNQNGISYTQICGRVTGYQYGSTDSINNWINDINSYYLDGVSITRGSPRQHVWSFMSGLKDSGPASVNCPCNSPPGNRAPQSFIGSDYFCESGNHASGWYLTMYTGDPLWDGAGCGLQELTCCAAPGLPWFHKDYGNMTTTDYIELRVCGNSGYNNEATPISYYEIYVK